MGQGSFAGLDLADEQFSRLPSDVLPRLAHRGEWDGGSRGERDVVIADDRHVLRHPEPCRDETLQQADSHQVVRCEHGGRALGLRQGGDFPRAADAGPEAQCRGAHGEQTHTLARAFGDIFSCFARPEEVFARPGFLDHLTALVPTLTVAPVPGPDRAALLELVA